MSIFKEKTRFDLEQEIMECWNVTKDIELYYDNQHNMCEDHRWNYLLGLQTMYELKFEKLWATFEQCIKNKQI